MLSNAADAILKMCFTVNCRFRKYLIFINIVQDPFFIYSFQSFLVRKADKRFFPFPNRDDEHGMVSEIVVENGTKIITLKTIIDVKNHYTKPVNIFRFDGRGWPKVGKIEPDQTFNVPLQAVYSEPYYEFSFQICDDCKF